MSLALQSDMATITLEEYEKIPEDKHIEVFSGIAYNMSSPSQEHQTISMELSTIINTYIRGQNGPCRVFHAPFDVKLEDNNSIMMCSDGLSNMVSAEEILKTVQSCEGEQNKAQCLIDKANENGGKDNIAVIVIEPFTDEVNI